MPTGSIPPSLHQTPRQTVARQTSRLTSKFASRPPLRRRTTGNNEFSPLALESTPWPAVARRPTTTSRRPTTLLSLQPPEVPPPVAHGSYSKASHTVLQHWLWRFLKKQTQTFAPLHKVFAKIKVDQPDSGTSAWTEIFFLHPVTGASIVHKLLASGLKTCLGFKDDSTAASTAYIVSVNDSASQLSHVQPMTVPDFYSLVTLMGLYL